MKSVQETFAPNGRCFGCGPTNARGLCIQSFLSEDRKELVTDWTPEPHHEAFEGVLNGGIIGVLMDCHSVWTAACHFMHRDQLESAPCTVTGDFHVTLNKPTPSKAPLRLVARVTESRGRVATVEATLSSGGQVTATCTGHFVAVKPDHPAYHRW